MFLHQLLLWMRSSHQCKTPREGGTWIFLDLGFSCGWKVSSRDSISSMIFFRWSLRRSFSFREVSQGRGREREEERSVPCGNGRNLQGWLWTAPSWRGTSQRSWPLLCLEQRCTPPFLSEGWSQGGEGMEGGSYMLHFLSSLRQGRLFLGRHAREAILQALHGGGQG